MTTVYKAPNRDVGVQQSGFRLQRLRAVALLFDSIENNPNALVYVAVETGDDVARVESSSSGTNHLFEQDKEYDEETGFSVNSPEVMKALSNFIVCWNSKDFSSNVCFGFYCTNRIAKERETDRWKKLGLSLPDQPILPVLRDLTKSPNEQIVEAVSKILINYIEDEKCMDKSLLESVQQWTIDQWTRFFKRIQFGFEKDDVQAVEQYLLERIKRTKLYSGKSHQNREQYILSALLDLLDSRQRNHLPSERFVYGAEVKNVFHEVASGNTLIDDQTWEMWKSLSKSDQRGLSEKAKSVCPEFSSEKLGTLSRKAAAGLLHMNQNSSDKRLLSVRYRIYDCCQDQLESLLVPGQKISQQDLESTIDLLVSSCSERLIELSETFNYPKIGNSLVREIVLELVGSCFLAFDKPEVVNG